MSRSLLSRRKSAPITTDNILKIRVTALPGGTHLVRAVYLGDADYGTSTSAPVKAAGAKKARGFSTAPASELFLLRHNQSCPCPFRFGYASPPP